MGSSMMESLVGDTTTLKSYFGGKDTRSDAKLQKIERTPSGTRKWIKELSPLANTVVGHCARILLLRPEELQQNFEEEAPMSAKQPSHYARNLLEYCCFRALSVATQVPDHLNDKEFRRLTYDMMLAWDAPGADHNPGMKNGEVDKKNSKADAKVDPAADEEEDTSIFYSDLMPLVAEVEHTVGLEAFSRLAPAIPELADLVTVHCQYEALTNTTGGNLPFAIYDKYLGELDKSVKSIRDQRVPSLVDALHLGEDETVIEVDGTGSGQRVLQHVGVSTWPGRLTLTDHALYFEASGVMSYDKAKKFDLSADLKHSIKADLTGPLGVQLFDKAIMYKSNQDLEPVVLEFSSLKGHSRRDYWLATIREVVAAHQFARTFQLEGVAKSEALAKAVLGIARLRAMRETFNVLPHRPDSLLTYLWGDVMPSGDIVLAALADTLRHSRPSEGGESSVDHHEGNRVYASSATAAVASLVPEGTGNSKEASVPISEIRIGDMTSSEKAVMQSREDKKKVDVAQATIDNVKVEGIGTNVAVLTELLKPFTAALSWIQALVSWEEPSKTILFCGIFSILIYKNWIAYIPALLLLSMASYIVWLWYMNKKEQFGVGEVVVPTPPGQSTVEQVLALQQALSQLDQILQAANIALLRIRAVCLASFPQATKQVVALLVAGAIGLAVLPIQWMALIVFFNVFTSQMKSRQESSARFNRRLSEWWQSIPVVPIRFLKPEEQESLDTLQQ